MATLVPPQVNQSLKLIPSYAFQPTHIAGVPSDLVEMFQAVQANSTLIQQLLESSKGTLSESLEAQKQCHELAETIAEEVEEARTEMILTLFRELPQFSHYIQAIPEIKHIMFKRRQIR